MTNLYCECGAALVGLNSDNESIDDEAIVLEWITRHGAVEGHGTTTKEVVLEKLRKKKRAQRVWPSSKPSFHQLVNVCYGCNHPVTSHDKFGCKECSCKIHRDLT